MDAIDASLCASLTKGCKLNWIHQFRDREDVTKSRKNFLVDNGFVLEEVAPFVACV